MNVEPKFIRRARNSVSMGHEEDGDGNFMATDELGIGKMYHGKVVERELKRRQV